MIKKYLNNALIISVIIAFIHTLFMAIVFTKSPEGSGLAGFIHFIGESFYQIRFLEAFITQSILIFLGCLVLLLWVSRKQPNQSLNEDGSCRRRP